MSQNLSETILPSVVVMTGHKGEGKDEAARVLIEKYGYKQVKFAAALKEMARALFEFIGEDPDMIERMVEGDRKEIPVSASLPQRITPRLIMQTLGTEWARDCLCNDFWVRITAINVKSLLDDGERVVITDCRFPNEQEAMQTYFNAVTIRIMRPGTNHDQTHPSEMYINDLDWQSVVYNEGTIEDLHRNVEIALANYCVGSAPV